MNSTRRALLASLLIALTVASGQALAGIPNIELVTVLVFVSGFLLGRRAGAIVGAVSAGAHSLFNVMGAAAPPVLAAQIVGYGAIGVVGATAGPAMMRLRRRPLQAVTAALVGAACNLGYLTLVSVATYFTFTTSDTLLVFIWGGITFTAIGVAWNAAVFAVAVPSMIRVLEHFRRELDGGPA